MDKLALHIWLDILSGAIEKKPAPGDHKLHLKKKFLTLSKIHQILNLSISFIHIFLPQGHLQSIISDW